MVRIREIRKRDNRIVPFDQSKISDAIHKAIRSVGGGDRPLADDLAAAVTLFLEKKFSGGIPSIEDIQDMVETVLSETGHSQIAAAYTSYRKKRSQIRQILQVHKEAPGGPEVEVGSQEAIAPWSKARIVAALVKEADLEVSVAEAVAGAVEEKVFRSGLRRISTALVRELVDNELFERGYAAKLKRQAPIGFPKYNLQQVIFSVDAKEPYSFAKDPQDTESVVARSVLRQYALEEIYSSEVAEAARDRRIHLHRVGEPLRLFRVNCSSDEELLTADGVTLPFLRVLRAVGEELSVTLPGSPALLRELGILTYRSRSIAAIASDESGLPPAPEQDHPASAIHYRLDLLPGMSCPRSLLEDGARYYARGLRITFRVCDRPYRRLVPAKVSLNLPQLAFRSGRTRLGDLYGEIDHALSLALKALLERRSFLRRAGRATDFPLWELFGGEGAIFDLDEGVCAVGVFGLADAVKFVTGKEMFLDPETFSLAVHLMEHLARKTGREARGLGIGLFLEETISPRILEEYARRDGQRFPEMKEVLRGRTGGAAYTPGVRLPLAAPLDPVTRNQYLAELYPFVDLAGIVEENPELRAGGEDVLVSLLEESMSLFSRRGGLDTADGAPQAVGTTCVRSVEKK